MTIATFIVAIEVGVVYAIVAIAVYVSFRVLNFPDLTIDGSFALGGAVAGASIVSGFNPFIAIGAAFLSGAIAGLFTAFLSIRLGILHLLAGILTMTGLFSVSYRVMGAPNVSLIGLPSILDPLIAVDAPPAVASLFTVSAIVAIAGLGISRWLSSEHGLAVRAAGANPKMAMANGVSATQATTIGLALSNALAATGGALFTQISGFADVSVGAGTIVFGLAGVILGEMIVTPSVPARALVGCVLGSVVYKVIVQAALAMGFFYLIPSDINMLTTALIVVAFSTPKLRNWIGGIEATRRSRSVLR